MDNAQSSFERLVMDEKDVERAAHLKTVALALWRHGFIPEVGHFTGEQACVAGYVLDRLSRFNCVPLQVKENVDVTLGKLRLISFEVRKIKSGDSADQLAQIWCVSSILKPYRGMLLALQRRANLAQDTKDTPLDCALF